MGVVLAVEEVVVVGVVLAVEVIVVVSSHFVSEDPVHGVISFKPNAQEEQFVHVLLSSVAAQKREIYCPWSHALHG